MAKITKAHHTGMTVRSLERSLAFYCDLLGFEVVFAWNPKAPYIGELVGYLGRFRNSRRSSLPAAFLGRASSTRSWAG